MSEVFQHPHFGPVRLGLKPETQKPRIELATYLDREQLPAPPKVQLWGKPVSTWPMFGNDSLGDCTCAAAGHMVQTWTANTTGEKTPSLGDVMAMYWNTGDGTDDGRMCSQVLDYWKTTGLGSDKILGYAAVSEQDMKLAHWLFGGVYIGISLPITAQTQRSWQVVGDGTGDSEPGSWGGHAINSVAYWQKGWTVITWGQRLLMSYAFEEMYVTQRFACVTTDWINSQGVAPSGVDLASLEADLKSI